MNGQTFLVETFSLSLQGGVMRQHITICRNPLATKTENNKISLKYLLILLNNLTNTLSQLSKLSVPSFNFGSHPVKDIIFWAKCDAIDQLMPMESSRKLDHPRLCVVFHFQKRIWNGEHLLRRSRLPRLWLQLPYSSFSPISTESRLLPFKTNQTFLVFYFFYHTKRNTFD